MELTSRMIKEKAKELGIDVIGIGNIERFRNAPTLLSPVTYFPKAKSVIAVLMRIPRGTYRGIEEGTHWHNYTFYSYNKLNTFFRPRLTYELCRFIEDCGWEAVPHYPAVPEGQGMKDPVAPGKVPPDVVLSVRIAAAAAGAGEIGYSKVFLTKKLGPRVRIGIILTDCVLEPDPILDTGSICLHCGACARIRGTPYPTSRTKPSGFISITGKKPSGTGTCIWGGVPSPITVSITPFPPSTKRTSPTWPLMWPIPG